MFHTQCNNERKWHGPKREWWLLGVRIMLNSPIFKGYFQKVEVSNFEVASDAFATFKVGCLNLHLPL